MRDPRLSPLYADFPGCPPVLLQCSKAEILRDDTLRMAERLRAFGASVEVEAETGSRPMGPVRLLTNLSFFGYCFNPVSFYYCFAEDGETVEAIVNEVTNTPWGERTTYVLPASAGERQGKTMRFGDTKKMHVSPFMPMDIEYDWCFAEPAERLSVFMANARDGKRFFDASIVMDREKISGRTLARVLVAYPFITLKIVAAIHWEALRLWFKRCPLYAHPEKCSNIAIDRR